MIERVVAHREQAFTVFTDVVETVLSTDEDGAVGIVVCTVDIIAFDATSRDHKFDIGEAISLIHSAKRYAMADISTFEEGINNAMLGADIISTTLSGYTSHSENNSEGPDFELLKKLVEAADIPVILEGKVWETSDVQKAFELGAYSVVIGSAITRPQLITKRFVNSIQQAK